MKAKLVIFIGYVILHLNGYTQNVSTHRQPCDKVEYHLYVHNIPFMNSNGIKVYNDESRLPPFINSLNNLLKETCIQFKVCKIDTIHDYNYYKKMQSVSPQDTNVHEMYRQPYSINVYWTGNSYGNKTTYNGICADTQSNAFIFIYMDIAPADEIFFNQVFHFMGIDFSDPSLFKKPVLPYKCGKLNREQRDYIIYKDRLCRKKRWLNASP